MKKLLILFAAFLLAVSASAVSINIVNSYSSSNNFQGQLNLGQIYPAPGGGGGFSLGSAITGTNGYTAFWMLGVDSFGNATTNAVPTTGSSTSSNNFVGSLNFAQVYGLGNGATLSSNTVIGMAGGAVAGSNYVTQALLAGSNFVSITTLAGSNFVSMATLAGSNFVNQVALANSNYVNQAALGASNYVTATGLTTSNYLANANTNTLLTMAGALIGGSNYLTTVTLTGPMTNNLMAGSAATNAFQPQSQNLTNWSTVATNVYVSIGTLAGSNFVNQAQLVNATNNALAVASNSFPYAVPATAGSTNLPGWDSSGNKVTIPWAGLPAGGSSTPNTLQTNTTQNAVTILNLIATNIISAATGQFTGNGAGLTNVNNTVYIVNTASTNANFQLFSSPTLYTVWKTNSANSMYLIGNGATNTIYGLAMVTVTVTGTNFLINY